MSKKQEIIDGYLNLGMQKGFDNVSLNDIADYAQIKKASIFSHFKESEDLKSYAINYSLEVLNSKNFEINPNAKSSEELFLNLINSFIDIFAEYPLNALMCLTEQKHSYNPQISDLSDHIDLMLTSRFQVALDFCVQRSWSDSNCTDELAILYASYFRKLLTKKNMSDDDLSDMLDIILATI